MASAWAPFVVHATSFLNDGGRLAFVLPAELITVNYAASIRAFLMESYAEITLVTFDQQVFPEVQEEVVLLFADGCHQGPTDHIIWRQCNRIEDFPDSPSKEFYPKSPTDRWSKGFVEPSTIQQLDNLEGRGFCRLDDWGQISLGSVTGSNSFFALSEDQMTRWKLSDEDTLPLSPPGSSHLRNLVLTNQQLIQLREAGKKTRLFYPGHHPTKAAQNYIEHGLELGVQNGYKCRKRSPWWKVPLSRKPDFFITYMNSYSPNICVNEAGVYCLNSVHGLVLNDKYKAIDARLLSLVSMCSATLLSAEIEGRAYGGGILKVEPREASNLLVPSLGLVENCKQELLDILDSIDHMRSPIDLFYVRDLVDNILYSKVEGYDAAFINIMREEKNRLYSRRRTRSKKRQ